MKNALYVAAIVILIALELAFHTGWLERTDGTVCRDNVCIAPAPRRVEIPGSE